MSRLRLQSGTLKGIDSKKAVFIIEYIKDFAVRRAAEAAGFPPERGYKLLEDPKIEKIIADVVQYKLEESGIDAEWLLYELADNHMIARQQGNIAASNAALKIIAQLAVVDAMAKQRVELDVVSDKELTDRIRRGRDRTLPTPLTIETTSNDDEPEQPPVVSFI